METRQSYKRRRLNQEFYLDLSDVSDGKLHTDDGYTFNIKISKLVKNSKYFERLFYGDIGKGKKDYLIPGIRGEVLGNILSYNAGKVVDITEDNACELLVAADYLLCDYLVLHIKNTFVRDNLSVRNCLSLFLVSFQIQRQDILDVCFRYTQTHFQSAVAVKDSDLHHLPLEALKIFLNDKNLCVEDENCVWLVIAKWIEADTPRRQSLVPDLLKCLAVSDVDEQLATEILQHNIVSSSPIFEEINTMEQCSSLQSNLETLTNYIRNQPNSPSVYPLSSRQPSHLHFIIHRRELDAGNEFHIYTTYDEKLDLWRELFEIDAYPQYIFLIGYNICMIDTVGERRIIYDLIENEWRDEMMPKMRRRRWHYVIAVLDGLLYAIGGTCARYAIDVYVVEVYDHVEGAWRKVSPMMPSSGYDAVTLGRSIYVVGNSPDFETSEMIAQMYDVESDSWVSIAPPSIFRRDFALVAYRERLYVIGGWDDDVESGKKSVEVFDPEKQEWETHKQLPHEFSEPYAVVVNDVLIVYDEESPNYQTIYPPLKWDIVEADWKSFEVPTSDEMCNYYFLKLDDRECMEWISRRNKDPQTEFHRCPFGSCI